MQQANLILPPLAGIPVRGRFAWKLGVTVTIQLSVFIIPSFLPKVKLVLTRLRPYHCAILLRLNRDLQNLSLSVVSQGDDLKITPLHCRSPGFRPGPYRRP
jgi:hypothetical protein